MMESPASASLQTDRLYTRQFFRVFGAVILFMTGVALQFHFGQYLAYLGHGVDTLGYVLSISIVGTLSIRLHIGHWIDRFGCRPSWLVGTCLFAAAVGSIQFTGRLWLIVVLRTLSAVGIATVMTTVAVFAANIAPPHRRAESIGTIGLAGFLGMIIGPALGDWIFTGPGTSIVPYRVFFSVSAACSLLAGGTMRVIAFPRSRRAAEGRQPVERPPRPHAITTARVIIRHWPGVILLIGVVFMMAFCFPMLFLERLAEFRGFRNIKVFFFVYGPTAIIFRIIFRRLPERLGRRRTLLLGLLSMAIGLLCMRGIHAEAQLVLPALLMGTGHCFIFPSMVDLAAGRLPAEHRGTGTSLILGAGDLGLLIGFATLGKLIERFDFDVALLCLAVTVLATAVLFAVTAYPRVPSRAEA